MKLTGACPRANTAQNKSTVDHFMKFPPATLKLSKALYLRGIMPTLCAARKRQKFKNVSQSHGEWYSGSFRLSYATDNKVIHN